ncbi:MAG: hypothetical protein V1870_05565 [Candidatus Aenigmatarchaeota archaeon]
MSYKFLATAMLIVLMLSVVSMSAYAEVNVPSLNVKKAEAFLKKAIAKCDPVINLPCRSYQKYNYFNAIKELYRAYRGCLKEIDTSNKKQAFNGAVNGDCVSSLGLDHYAGVNSVDDVINKNKQKIMSFFGKTVFSH